MHRAAVIRELNGDFEVLEVDPVSPRDGEIAVRLAASGICHSDFSIRSGVLPFLHSFPAVLGHEGSGTVVEVGPGVSAFAPGDKVVMSFKPMCGRCWYCTHGEAYLCTFVPAHPSLPRSAGGETVHAMGTATFQDLTIVPVESAVKVPDDAPLEIAALLGCGVMTGFGAAVNTAHMREGDSVAVIGCGGVGLSAVQAARVAGAGEIIAVDLVDEKLQLASEVGATRVVNAGAVDAVDTVKAMTDGRGADHVFEVIGTDRTIHDAVSMTRPGGETVLVGLPGPEVTVKANAVSLILDNRAIVGSMYGSCDFGRDVLHLLELYEDGRLKLDEIVTTRLPLEGIQRGFDLMAAGSGARSLVVF